MQRLIQNIKISVNEEIFLKDPATSTLGKKTIAGSIKMINDIGFEAYTFRKLAKEISSTEASIYRYFENKHKLLLYLISWYWAWMEYRLVFGLANVEAPEDRLERALKLFTQDIDDTHNLDYIDVVGLHQIVITDSSKVYHTKEVDDENKIGLFAGYKSLVARTSDIILEINPAYKYPHMLISTVIEGAHNQWFFREHLPSLTDSIEGDNSIYNFYRDLVFDTIQKRK